MQDKKLIEDVGVEVKRKEKKILARERMKEINISHTLDGLLVSSSLAHLRCLHSHSVLLNETRTKESTEQLLVLLISVHRTWSPPPTLSPSYNLRGCSGCLLSLDQPQSHCSIFFFSPRPVAPERASG